ncbi:MAG: hypothetical protein JO326_13670 [Acetobacteraceae bacterium]|nr:hypothetical protein [Acetobacteraceae bacterium]
MVGTLLLISSRVPGPGGSSVRSNLSCWYARPEVRIYAPLLVNRILRLASDSVVNISPAVTTLRTIEAQGFRRVSGGAWSVVPALGSPRFRVKVMSFPSRRPAEVSLDPAEAELLRDHARFGCITLCCRAGGRDHPFVFRRRRVDRIPVPCAHLVYCRDIADLGRFAGPIGRFLAKHGILWMIVQADSLPPGLVGRYYADRMPVYVAGDVAPRPGDLAYTEFPILGF